MERHGTGWNGTGQDGTGWDMRHCNGKGRGMASGQDSSGNPSTWTWTDEAVNAASFLRFFFFSFLSFLCFFSFFSFLCFFSFLSFLSFFSPPSGLARFSRAARS